MLVRDKLDQIPLPHTSVVGKAIHLFRRRHMTQKFLTELHLTETACVIDVGCRAGEMTRQIAAIVARGKVVGVDLSERKVRRAMKRCSDFRNVDFYVGSLEALPWEGNSFDYATCLDSFHLYPNPRTALTEMLRVLRPGGKLFLGLCNYLGRDGVNRGCRLFRNSPYPLFTPEQCVQCLEHSGFLNVWQKVEAEYLLTVGTKA